MTKKVIFLNRFMLSKEKQLENYVNLTKKQIISHIQLIGKWIFFSLIADGMACFSFSRQSFFSHYISSSLLFHIELSKLSETITSVSVMWLLTKPSSTRRQYQQPSLIFLLSASSTTLLQFGKSATLTVRLARWMRISTSLCTFLESEAEFRATPFLILLTEQS